MSPSPDSFRPILHQDVSACVEDILARVGRRIVLGLPIGMGKPNQLVDAFYRAAEADSSLSLDLFTGLTLEPPRPGGELERRLVGPLATRLFPGWPGYAWLEPWRRGELPPNVRVFSFFFPPGRMLDSPAAQQSFVAANYTHVARDMRGLGVNVLAQMVGGRHTPDGRCFSLSGNPDVTLDLMAHLAERRARGEGVAVVAQVNEQMPYMLRDAELAPESFDFVVDERRYDFPPFALPDEPVTTVDHAIAVAASSLVADGGTLQIGIGSLSDAIVQAICLRHRSGGVYRRALRSLGLEAAHGELIEREGGTGPFERGLYASSEMLVDGLLYLYKAGILKRRVYPHAGLQRLLDAGTLGETVGPETIEAMLDAGCLPARPGPDDVRRLQELGIFDRDLRFEDGRLVLPDGEEVPAELDRREVREALYRCGLGERLLGGTVAHGGFFLGPRRFLRTLHDLTDDERREINMTSVSWTNQLYGDQELKIAQRRKARFLNSCMMVTLLGAAVSDGLEDGRVLSGVGGQYDFVAMAHALPEARSILLMRSVRTSHGEPVSNFRWSYGHVTIPRHLRDVVVTEYGIADLRGKSDAEVIGALLNVADSRFQDELAGDAKRAGKLPRDHRIPDRHRENVPERLERALAPFREDGHFPEWPQGSDFTPEEQVLAKALKALKAKVERERLPLPGRAHAAKILNPPAAARPYLERMELDRPRGIGERLLRAQVLWGLALVGEI